MLGALPSFTQAWERQKTTTRLESQASAEQLLPDVPQAIALVLELCATKRHNLKGPQGVRSRNSDNIRLREVLRWEPSVRLEQGLAVTFEWIAGSGSL